MSTEPVSNVYEDKNDLGKSPQSVARRWKLELSLANRREEHWRECVKKVYRQYTPAKPEDNSFNIFYPNTEMLRQSIYNSLPQPQVKRRYDDDDPVGSAVSDVLNRSLEFCQESYDFDLSIKTSVLDMLIPGRAVTRIKYIPVIDQEEVEDDSEEPYESLGWESVVAENVYWDDFRMSDGRSWDEVNWIAFKHRMKREELIEKFGEEIGNAISLEEPADDEVRRQGEDVELFKSAEIWEIWDKEEKEVIFISQSYANPCKVQDDPLNLQEFFPIPRPLYAIENSDTLLPAIMFKQYEQQANELNRISKRINKIIGILRVRGIYDATLGEISSLSEAFDGELIPAKNVTALLERGGLDKAIWMMPIEQAALVLKELYLHRDATKQVIYEITGISDIMRSASDPTETFGAQKLKTQWGSQRLQRMQREVQRYIRDILRLKAEIIAEKFQPETLEQMTLIKMPHQQEVDYQFMLMAQKAAMSGQPPPQPPNIVTWEQVIEVLRNDVMRNYHIDIETDSTISASQDSDMAGLREVLTGVSQLMEAFAPAVQAGVMPIEAVKEMMLVIARRSRMGSAVEGELKKMHAPAPPTDTNAAKMQADMQLEQMKMQAGMQQKQQDLEFEKQKAMLDAQVESHKQMVQAQQVQHQNELESQRQSMQHAQNAVLEKMRIDADERMNSLEQQVKLMIAEGDHQARREAAAINADSRLMAGEEKRHATL